MVYEAVMLRSCDAQALVSIFASGDKAMDKLILATDLKLDRVRSGCRSDADDATIP